MFENLVATFLFIVCCPLCISISIHTYVGTLVCIRYFKLTNYVIQQVRKQQRAKIKEKRETFLEHLENRPWITGVNIQCSFKIAFQKSADLSPTADEFHYKQKEQILCSLIVNREKVNMHYLLHQPVWE